MIYMYVQYAFCDKDYYFYAQIGVESCRLQYVLGMLFGVLWVFYRLSVYYVSCVRCVFWLCSLCVGLLLEKVSLFDSNFIYTPRSPALNINYT